MFPTIFFDHSQKQNQENETKTANPSNKSELIPCTVFLSQIVRSFSRMHEKVFHLSLR